MSHDKKGTFNKTINKFKKFNQLFILRSFLGIIYKVFFMTMTF